MYVYIYSFIIIIRKAHIIIYYRIDMHWKIYVIGIMLRRFKCFLYFYMFLYFLNQYGRNSTTLQLGTKNVYQLIFKIHFLPDFNDIENPNIEISYSPSTPYSLMNNLVPLVYSRLWMK